MRVEEKYHYVNVPKLNISTQGKDVNECISMEIDLVKCLDDYSDEGVIFDGFIDNDKESFYLKIGKDNV